MFSKGATVFVLIFISRIADGRSSPVQQETTVNGVSNVVVETEYGPVKGVLKNDVKFFHGIPFAKPPTGQLRWRPPEPPNPWGPTVYDATYPRAACPQKCSNDSVFCPPKVAEDCLYLEVVTPADADETSNLSVVVYIHGGGFDSMSASMPIYDATRFVQLTKVIAVLIEYRLGALGFAMFNSSSENSSGNYAILDQLLALQWVRNNIRAFGGDPRKVTLHGQSAGAQSCLIHLNSPESSKLFRYVILESDPVTLPYKTKDEAFKRGLWLAQELGCLQDNVQPDLTCLRSKDPFDVVDAQRRLRSSITEILDKMEPFSPVVDNIHVHDQAANALQVHIDNGGKPKPVIWGVTKDEGWLYIKDLFPSSVSHWIFTIMRSLVFSPKEFPEAASIYDVTNATDARKDLADMTTDGIFKCPVRCLANTQVNGGSDQVWVYEWSHVLESSIPESYAVFSQKAAHGIQVPFVFQSFLSMNVTPDASDLMVSDAIINYYGNFIKTGDPNKGSEAGGVLPAQKDSNTSTSGLPNWPKAREINDQWTQLVFDQETVRTQSEGLDEDKKCNLWDKRGYNVKLSLAFG
ncbi:unnamed protein product [Lymnaea stagnalis]|uniref:Carboxylic ester hydrolase n=1 Tax=Lymnaea stagnalis TaxID=6523 RepID=A0AAV2H4G0_LYMST